MARIKGGMNAKKKHNRTLKLAKGYRGARSKQYRVAKQSVNESSHICLRRKKRAQTSDETAWICTYQCSCKNEWIILQQTDARLKRLQVLRINRKILTDMAINDVAGFTALAELAKETRL